MSSAAGRGARSREGGCGARGPQTLETSPEFEQPGPAGPEARQTVCPFPSCTVVTASRQASVTGSLRSGSRCPGSRSNQTQKLLMCQLCSLWPVNVLVT